MFKVPAALLALVLSLSAVRAQSVQVYNEVDPDRRTTSVLMLDPSFVPHGGVTIDYSAAAWKEEYNAMLDRLKGKDARLGKNWWTTLSTMTAIEIGGTKLEPGAYFLGLRCDKDGNFSLLVLNPTENLKAKAAPWMAATWKGGVPCTMTLAKDSLKETQDKLLIEITADPKQPTVGKLSIRWGKHELSAPVKFDVKSGKGESDKGK